MTVNIDKVVARLKTFIQEVAFTGRADSEETELFHDLLAALEQSQKAYENRTETLKAVRDLIRAGEHERAVLWICDSLSGHTEALPSTLLKMSDERNALKQRVAELEGFIERYGDHDVLCGVREGGIICQCGYDEDCQALSTKDGD